MTAPTPDTLSTELPTDIGWGWLDWRLMFFDGDGGDADDAPDLIPAAGAIVTATPNVQLASHLTGTTFTAGKRPIQGIIDTQGRLCRRNAASGMPEATPGLPVIATDSAALTSQGFAYEITVSHPALKIGKFSTQVSAGERVDLAQRIGQSIPPGTQVTVLTPEIRAEIEKAVASVTPTLPDDLVTADELAQALAGVQVDTSGLATTEALQQVQTELETKVDATALDEVERSIPAVVLREAPLVDGELIQSTRIEAIEQVDGSTALVLIQTTSTGREVTATIPTISAAAPAASTDVLQAFTWQDLEGLSGPPSQGGWIERRGGLVTLHIRTPQTVGITEARLIAGTIEGATVGIPPFGDSRDPVGVQMIRADGTSYRERSRVTEWAGNYYLQPATGEDPTLDALILTWWTNDRGPISLGAAA